MKKLLLFALLSIVIIFSVSISSCKKDKEKEDLNYSSLEKLSQDELLFENFTNEALDEANDVVSPAGLKSTYTLPCNADIDTSYIQDTVVYTITYHGANCNNSKLRFGVLKVKKTLNTNWSQAGAKLSVEFINLKIAKVTNPSKWLLFNGKKTWENVSGGLIKNLSSTNINPVIHHVTGNINTMFADSTTRSWIVARKKTFSGVYPGSLVLTIEGFGSANGYSNLVTWGTNRDNEAFYTSISLPITIKQSCYWLPTSGVKTHQIPSDNKSATITFGFDLNNQPINSYSCAQKYKVDWVKGSASGSFFAFL